MRSCLARTELTFDNHNMKIMSLGNKAKLAFQLIVSSVVAQCSCFASASLHSRLTIISEYYFALGMFTSILMLSRLSIHFALVKNRHEVAF